LLGVQISLDGDNPETHDNLRGVQGAWEKTMQGIKNCASEGLPFQVAPLMHPANFDQLDAILEIARANGANAFEAFDFVASGRGREHAELELDNDQRIDLTRKFMSYLERPEYEHMTFRLIAIPQYYLEAERGLHEDVMLTRFVRTCCAAGTRYATILPDGEVVPCMLLQVSAGNVHEKPFNEIWEGAEVFQQLRDRNLLKGKCSNCRYKTICAGARCKAYIKTGDMLAEDPTCWFPEKEIS
jgi:radical SAM protein with 4Fe4S-binding SPASM domain